MIKKSLLSFMVTVVSFASAFSQSYNTVSPSDANKAGAASSLSNLIAVDNFTGRGNVTIPIYNFQQNGLDVGVALIYDAKGIPVNSISSSVGLGWQLSAGGSITREVYGIEDEVTLPKTHDSAPTTDSIQGFLVPGARVSPSDYTSYEDDKERDRFNFNLGGRNISVIFGRDQYTGDLTFQTKPFATLRIKAYTKDISISGEDSNVRDGIGNKCGLDLKHDIVTFVVKDESGNTFYFDRGDQLVKEINFGDDTAVTNLVKYYPIQKWDLVKIETYDGITVKYDYVRKYVKYLDDVTETMFPVAPRWDNLVPTQSVWFDPLQIKNVYWEGYKSHISRITYSDATQIVFDLDTNQRCDCKSNYRLKNIIVKQEFDNNVRDSFFYELNQAFFSTPGQGLSATEYPISGSCSIISGFISSSLSSDEKENLMTRALRLKLKSIAKKRRIYDPLGTIIAGEPYYTFNYNSQTLAYRFSPSQDFYGYYNGKASAPFIRSGILYSDRDTFYTSIPYHKDTCSGYPSPGIIYTPYWGAHREYDFAKAQMGTLTKITNCSGGAIDIEYTDYTLTNPDRSYDSIWVQGPTIYGEPSTITLGYDIDPELQASEVNDGLCIGKVKITDGYSVENTYSIEYSYEGGQRFNRGGYTWYPNPTYNWDYVFTNYFVSPLSFVYGSNHGFSKVTITNKGYYGQQISKDVITYTNLMYKNDNGETKTWMRKPTGKYWHFTPGDLKQYAIGNLLRTEHYDNTGTLVSHSSNTYETKALTLPELKSYKWYSGTYWEYRILDQEIRRPIEKRDTSYISSKSMVNSTLLDYDEFNNIHSRTEFDSKGDTYKTIIKYNYDYYLTPYVSGAISTMTFNNIQLPLGKEVWKLSSGDSSLVSFTMSAPMLDTSGIERLHIDGATYDAMLNTPLSSSDAWNTNYIDRFTALNYRNYPNNGIGSNFLKTAEVTLFDAQSNVLETRVGTQDFFKSMVWDINYGHKLAEVSNAKYNEIAYTSFESKYAAYGVSDYNKGNLDFYPSSVVFSNSLGLSSSITGKYLYDLRGGDIFSKPMPANKYRVSFWWKGSEDPGTQIEMTNGVSTFTITVNLQSSVGSWRLYSGTYDLPANYKVHFKGSNFSGAVYIDEIRIHPMKSTMNTYTYVPLLGSSSSSDSRNYIYYNVYDFMGRLAVVKDMRGNVIKKYEVACNGTDNAPTEMAQENPQGQ